MLELVESKNPTETLCSKFKDLSAKEDNLLRSRIRELTTEKFIVVSLWADNLPYNVIVNESAIDYVETMNELSETENSSNNKNTNIISIGNGNKIKNVNISNIQNTDPNKKGEHFFDKHPVITGIIVGVLSGLILMFSFWDKIINWIEGVF